MCFEGRRKLFHGGVGGGGGGEGGGGEKCQSPLLVDKGKGVPSSPLKTKFGRE